MKRQGMKRPAERSEKLTYGPTGFVSRTIKPLRSAEGKKIQSTRPAAARWHDPEISSKPTSLDSDYNTVITGVRNGHKPWTVDDQLQNGGETDSEEHDMCFSPKDSLPKGVIRGCPKCSTCQKVRARWVPGRACNYILEEVPVFHPHEEEFKDTFKYINSIRQQIEPFGFGRIVPPRSWQLPCFLDDDDVWLHSKVSTRVQKVNELRNCYCSSEKEPVADIPRETKRRKSEHEFGDGSAANFSPAGGHAGMNCRSEDGPQFSFIAFKRYADYFKRFYFSEDSEVPNPKAAMRLQQWEPSERNIEGEYWRIVEKPTEEIEVLFGSDLDAKSTASESDHTSGANGWDPGCVSEVPGSLLSFEKPDSTGLLAPRLHVGMCFSSLPWTVEEHHLFKLSYLHMGAPRIWYGTSGCSFSKLKTVMKKHCSDTSREHIELLHKQGRQFSPATLESEGVQVYRCIQRPREFVLFLPGSYHSGFDCGFNCSVSAVFAPLDWLPHGQTITELYREQQRKTHISFDKLLLRAANETVKALWEGLVEGENTPNVTMWKGTCGKEGILGKSLRKRIKSEVRCRQFLSRDVQSRRMDSSFDAGHQKRECTICYYDLYMSAASCQCSPNKFSCLKHSKHFCSCPWSNRIFLVRYMISELEILLEAVEGNLNAVRSWVKQKLELRLYRDELDAARQELTVDTSYVAEVSKDEGSVSQSHIHQENTLGNNRGELMEILKGRELAADMLKVTNNSSSSSPSESDSDSSSKIEAYVAQLEAQVRGNVPPLCND